MASWFDLKGTFQTIFRIGKNKTAIDANTPTVLRTFYMPDAEVDLRSGTDGQMLAKNSATSIGWSDVNAQRMLTRVFNDLGSTVAKAKVVYLNGVQGDRPKIALSQANNEMNSSKTFGLTYAAISNMDDGQVISEGLITGLNTDVVGWTEGDALWLSPSSAGDYTNVKPAAPDHAVFIGTLVRKHPTQGSIQVKIQNGYELQELHNVSIPTTPSNGQVLTYNASTSLWYAATPGGGGGGGYTEIPNGGTLTGTYSGEVYCVGDVSLASNTLVKGSLYIVGNITNPSGYNLSVDGDLLVEGSLDFTRSTVAQTGELTVQGDCHVGYEIENTVTETIKGFSNLNTVVSLTPLGTTYQTALTIISPSLSLQTLFPIGSRVLMNAIPYDVISIQSAVSPTEQVSNVIDAENFSLQNFAGPTFQARGLQAGDSIQFTSGVNSGQFGTILSISGDDLTFALGTFTSPPGFGDQLTISPANGFVEIQLKGTQNLGLNDSNLVGVTGSIEYDTWKSFLFREQVTTANEIFIGGDLTCYRFDVSASQTSANVKGKEAFIEGNLTLKSFKEDVSGVSYYDYIILQGSDGNDANTLTVRGSVYNGSIFGRPQATLIGSSPSQASHVKIYGDCILSSINAYQLFSGFVDLSSNDLVNDNTVLRKGGGDFFVGGKFIGGGINLSGADRISGLTAYASSSGDLIVQGDIFIAFGAWGTPFSPDNSILNNFNNPQVNYITDGKISLKGGVDNTASGGGAGILYCSGNVYGYNFFNGSAIEIECIAGNEGALGKITIVNDCFTNITFRAGNTAVSTNNASIGGSFSPNVYVGGSTFGNITMQAGDATTLVNGGNVNNNCLYVRESLYGSLTIRSGSGTGTEGGIVNANPLQFDGNYMDSLNVISGSGIKGGTIAGNIFAAAQIPTVRNFTLLSGNGTTGPAGSILTTSNYIFNCIGSISVRIGTTQNSTTDLDFPDQTITINGSANVTSIVVRNMNATSAGGIARVGINLIINGNVQLRDAGTITLQGGTATTGSSSRAPKLRINGSLFGSLNDTANTGVIITGGNVTTGNASLGTVDNQTLYVVGDVNIGRITVNGGNQTTASGAVGGSAGDIASGAIFVNGKLKAARITLTGGNLTSSGAIAGQRGGNAGLVEAGSINTPILTCNGGTVNAAAATKGSAGGFRISNLIVTDNSYIGAFTANDSTGGGVASTNAVQTQLAGHVIIDAWTLPTRTTYTVKCIGVPTSLIVRSFTGKNKLANNANAETAANLAADSMYFSTGSTWRSVTNAAFV